MNDIKREETDRLSHRVEQALDLVNQAMVQLHHAQNELIQVQKELEQPEINPLTLTTSSPVEVSSQPKEGLKQPDSHNPGPSLDELAWTIRHLDKQYATGNYLPIFYLRRCYASLTFEELNSLLYEMEKAEMIELSALQEVVAYTPDQIKAGIPQNIGGPLFFIIDLSRDDGFNTVGTSNFSGDWYEGQELEHGVSDVSDEPATPPTLREPAALLSAAKDPSINPIWEYLNKSEKAILLALMGKLWLTANELADLTGFKPGTIRKSCTNLRSKNMVKSTSVSGTNHWELK